LRNDFKQSDMNELTIEDLLPFFVAENGETKITPATKIARVMINGERYYFEKDKGLATRLLPSVTTFLSRWIPKPYHLEKYIRESGEEGIIHRDRRAAYGTCMHVLIERLVKAGYNMDKDAPRAAAQEFIGMDATETEIKGLQKDLCAFAVWAKAHDLFVVALEVPLYSENIGISGMCDLVGIITVKEGKETHRVNCIIDFKSGRKGFYETHAFQLHIYRDMWNEMYGDVFAVKRVFNWGPKDWKKETPTCHFEEQTSEEIESLLSHLYAMEKIRPMQPKKDDFAFFGIADGVPDFSKTDIITLIVAAQEKAAAPLAGEIAEDAGLDAMFSGIQPSFLAIDGKTDLLAAILSPEAAEASWEKERNVFYRDCVESLLEGDFVAAAASETHEPVIAPLATEKPAKAAKKGGFSMNQLLEAVHGLGGFGYMERDNDGSLKAIQVGLNDVLNKKPLSSGRTIYSFILAGKAVSLDRKADIWSVKFDKKEKTDLSEEDAVDRILSNKELKAALQSFVFPLPAPLPAVEPANPDILPGQLPLF